MTDNKPQMKPRTFWLAKPDLDFDLNWKQIHAAEFPHKNTLGDYLEVIEASALTQANAEIERLKTALLDLTGKVNRRTQERNESKAEIARLSAEVEKMRQAGVREINRLNFEKHQDDLIWSQSLSDEKARSAALEAKLKLSEDFIRDLAYTGYNGSPFHDKGRQELQQRHQRTAWNKFKEIFGKNP